MSKLTKFLRVLSPFKLTDPSTIVPPHIQSEIDSLVKSASDQVARLRANHSVQTIEEQLAADLADLDKLLDIVRAQGQRLKADAAAKIAEAKNVLPAVLPPVPRVTVTP